jgi:hypothetical protein
MAPTNQIVKDFSLARISIIPGAHALVQRLRQGTILQLARDTRDQFDPDHAVMVIHSPPGSRRKIGYLPLDLAKTIAPLLDAGVSVIARKAPNPLYGVCQVAYIPPEPAAAAELKVPAATPVAIEMEESVAEAEAETIPVSADVPIKIVEPAPNKTEKLIEQFVAERPLPEGVTQRDLDEATEMPPLGDSRRLRGSAKEKTTPQHEDDSNDEPITDETRSPR